MERYFLINFSGDFQFDTIEELLTQVKEKLNDLGVKVGMKKKIVNVLVESMENIYKYTKLNIKGEYAKINFVSRVSLEKKNTSYIIKAGNTILNSDIERLKTKIDKVNSLDCESLKAYYKEIIDNGKFSDKGGAGLGILDMVMKSGNPIKYRFTPETENLSFYEIEIQIDELNGNE